jgi:hypothetical protein
VPTLTDDEYTQFRALVDREAVREVILRNSRAIDRVDEDLLRTVYWPDGWDSHSIFDGSFEDYVPWVIDTLNGMIATQHNVANILIDLDGNDAYTESYFIAHHKIRGEDSVVRDMFAAGRYVDHIQRRGREWRIKHRRAVFDWDINQPSTSTWEDDERKAMMERGVRGREDRVFSRDHLT